MKLYPYQLENKNQIMELWKKHSSILYQLPTGGGKTVVINSIIEEILDKKILILVHRQEIIFQIRNRLKQRGITAGVLIGGYEENINADILIGSILTVARDSRLQDILNKNFDYMIIDEAHHACSDSYVKTITNFKNHNSDYRLLGVTATPYRKDGKKLNKLFDILIKGPTYSELREGGYLSDYVCYAAKLDGLSDVDLSGGDFKLSSLSKYMRSDWLLNKAIKMYKDKGNNEQMLVFCVDIKHAKQTKQAYIDAGFDSVAIIDSNTPDDERKEINKLYRDKYKKEYCISHNINYLEISYKEYNNINQILKNKNL
jgi:superfamily II DNA or RNA helicase